MFLGHFGVAFAAKKAAPKTSLGTLVFAAQVADLLWPILLLFGIEKVRTSYPDYSPPPAVRFHISYPISHSLVTQLGWGALSWDYLFFYCEAQSEKRADSYAPGSLLCHRTGFSISSRTGRTCPIYPGGPKYGLGMWNSIPLTILRWNAHYLRQGSRSTSA